MKRLGEPFIERIRQIAAHAGNGLVHAIGDGDDHLAQGIAVKGGYPR